MIEGNYINFLNIIFVGAAVVATIIFVSIHLSNNWDKFIKKNKKNPRFFLIASVFFGLGTIYKLVTKQVDSFNFWWALSLTIASWYEYKRLIKK